MNLPRTSLLVEITHSPDSYGKPKAFYGKGRQERRDVLEKPASPTTSEGTKTIGTGTPKNPVKRNVKRWTPGQRGELRTEPGPPPALDKIRPPIPLKKHRRVFADVNLIRSPLLVDHHDGG